MKRFALTCCMLGILVTTAEAACPSAKATIFSCTTTNGKQVEVCDLGATISYRFGKNTAKPEIMIKVPREKVTTYQWEGIGRYMSYAVTIPNGPVTYTTTWGMDRLSEEHGIEASILVEQNGKTLATIPCVPKTVINNMEGVKLSPTP